MPKKHAEKGHMTVKIPRLMAVAIEEFLQTDKAKRLGLDSKSDVVTAAVRGLLEKYQAT